MAKQYRRRKIDSFKRNHGVPGVVYVLENDGLRASWFKIGCSSRSGFARARDLNGDANTGTPGAFRCIFEVRTLDCGVAEQRVFKELAEFRRGKWGQEFFAVELDRAKGAIRRICAEVDNSTVVAPPPPIFVSKPAVTVVRPTVALTPVVTSSRGVTIPIRLRWVLGACVAVAVVWFNSGGSDKRTAYKAPPAQSDFTVHESQAPKPPAKDSVKWPAALDPVTQVARQTKPEPASAVPAATSAIAIAPAAPEASARVASVGPSKQTSTTESASVLTKTEQRDDETAARHLTRQDLTQVEAVSLEAACATDKYNNGPLSYRKCVQRQLTELETSPRHADLSSLSRAEATSLDSACSSEKYNRGPAAYNKCAARQLALLQDAPRGQDLSGLTRDERSSVDSACSHAKYNQGPAAYARCVQQQVSELETAPRNVDLSSLSQPERVSINSACSNAKYNQGAAALNRCLANQLELMQLAPRNVDLSSLSRSEKTSIESACSNAKYNLGPAEYNRCLYRQMQALRAAEK